MGNLSQLRSLLNHIRPDAMESILDSYFDAFWEELSPEIAVASVADMTTEERIIMMMSFIATDGPNGEMIRDIFYNLVANNGGTDWIKRVVELPA